MNWLVFRLSPAIKAYTCEAHSVGDVLHVEAPDEEAAAKVAMGVWNRSAGVRVIVVPGALINLAPVFENSLLEDQPHR